MLYILGGLGLLAAFISELTKHRASAIARFRPHDDPSDADAGRGSGGAASPRPAATDEDRP